MSTGTGVDFDASNTMRSKSGTSKDMAPVNMAVPTVYGTPKIGQTLTRTLGTWTDNPAPTVTGNWQRDGVNIGQTGPTYTLVAEDDGTTIRWQDSATNIERTVYANSAGVAVTSANDAFPYTFPFALENDAFPYTFPYELA